MIRKITQFGTVGLMLSSLATASFAGKLYRFPDENGVPTVSRSLPPAAAQKGYDVFDDKSLRLIEHVAPALTPEQISELEYQLKLDQENSRLAKIAEQKAEKQRKKQAIYDQNLLASYLSEQDLITTRDSEISFRQTLITKNTSKQQQLDQNLFALQQQAADQELSGIGLSKNLKKRLSASQQAIDNNKNTIIQLNEEILVLTEKFESELARFRELTIPKADR